MGNRTPISIVTDAANDPNSTLGDFHYSGAKSSSDYTYDGNGNLTSDANKQISSITYNYLDKPELVTFTGKGTIQYVYDADGDKLQKVVTDNTVSPAKITTTNYCDGFVYNSDTLLYFLTGEGRVRWLPPRQSAGETEGAFVYDYFLRDHLGDVRSVITEQTSEETYAATMEPQNAQVENQLFDNIESTRVPTPPGFTSDSTDKDVSQLDGSDGNNTIPRVGPAIVLKVMAGDTITMATQAWYQGTVEPPPSGASNLLNDLLSALTGGVISNSHSLYSTTDNNPNSVLSGDLPAFFTNDENTNYNASAPKAFLNYVAFDNQLNMNSANSGVVQVPTITGSEQAQPLVAPEQIIQKDGYLYIYVSNESAQRVFFDNLVIHHNKGHLLEEDQYYPYGLKMAGISDEALPPVPNNYLYNGKELQQNEFSDGSGLEDYDYGFRGYDPQLGRFTEQDPLTDEFATVSPYQYGLNDPVGNIDKDGLAVLPTVSVFATAVNRMSAFSSFTSKLLGEASLASKVINFSSLGVHVLQTGGVIGLNWLTRSVGMEAASNLGGPGHGILPLTKHYSGPFDNKTINDAISEGAQYFGGEVSEKYYSKWVTRRIMGRAIKKTAGELEDSEEGELGGFTYQDVRDRNFPVIGDIFEDEIDAPLKEELFHAAETEGYKGLIKYISRGQENESLKFSAVYLTDKDVLELEKQGSFSLRGKTIYGQGSTFPDSPNLDNMGNSFTHLLYFPSQFVHMGKALLRFSGIVPMK